ncbi:MAG: DUF6371 domain-containing protein [Putridiphycobacter sp.]|nr:DUF6371 domain-containing protein [Putridiphycobacter sp.]
MAYKFTLDPSSKKFECPSCKKKRFVRYIEVATKKLAPPHFGKCDRADNCGYFEYPKGIVGDYNTIQYKKEEKAFNHYLPIALIQPTLKLYQQNNFVQYLYSKFAESEVKNAITTYKIGTATTFKSATLFWLVDINQKLRSGKIMQFDKHIGKRVKQPKAKIDWVHSQLKRKKILPKNYKLKQCLFGEHQVNHFEKCNKKIAIVESEKSAIIMSIIFPKYLWLACGAKDEIKLSKLLVIKSRDIILYPDKSCFNHWQSKADELNELGFNIVVSGLLENIDIENGADLVDLLT